MTELRRNVEMERGADGVGVDTNLDVPNPSGDVDNELEKKHSGSSFSYGSVLWAYASVLLPALLCLGWCIGGHERRASHGSVCARDCEEEVRQVLRTGSNMKLGRM